MGEVIIYNSDENNIELVVNIDNETVWLSQEQLVLLFQRDQSVISRHIRNIFNENELEEKSNMQKMHIANSDKPVSFYNLEVIISVGYRVKSKQGTQFRQWATQRLKDYLVKGHVLNERRLKELDYKYSELQNAIKLASNARNIERLSSTEAKGILSVIEQYAYALETLDKYDHQNLTIETLSSEEKVIKLPYNEAIKQILIWRNFQNAGSLFGNEKDQSFKSSLETIYQTFDGIDLYPSIEEKAANLLYFVVKNHSFTDGNKRIAAGLFVYFLDMNNKLLNKLGNKRLGDNALVAITIMIAESKSDDKDIMTKLVVNLINNKN